MSVEIELLVGRFDAQGDTANIEPLNAFVLPDFPENLLPETLLRLSAAECDLALRKNVLAVSWLPQLTLHAVLSEHGVKNAQSGKKRVIAKLNRVVFLKFVGKVLGPRLKFEATEKLRLQSPEFSASSRMTPEQMTITSALMVGLAILLFALPQIEAFVVIAIVFNLFFLLTITFKILWLFLPERATKRRAPIKLSDEELPIYTILVPVFRETGVLHQLIAALQQLRYPSEKLDIKIILEESDTAMHRALAGISLPPQFEVIIVPAGKPQTKPRALNYAMRFARGELLTIYDAEDIPEPQQLQKAAAQFSSAGPELSCLQAELAFYNPNENWLTRGIRAQTPQEFSCV